MNRRAVTVALSVALLAGSIPPAGADENHPTVAPGYLVPEFSAQAVDGSARHVAFAKGTATVLLFFLSSCPTCHKQIPDWNRAYQRRPKNVNVVGVILDREPPGFFDAYPVAFPVVRSPGREFLNTYKVSRTPTTLRVAAGGKVEGHGEGMLDPITLGEFFRP
jgi:peroxiredoxin